MCGLEGAQGPRLGDLEVPDQGSFGLEDSWDDAVVVDFDVIVGHPE